jgi:hypothetical protein
MSTAYKITRTVIDVECDVCKKIIPAGRWRDEETKYFEITTGHHDWGNDSIDSMQTRDVCPECAPIFIAEYLKKASTTGYLELSTEYSYADKETTIVDTPPKEGEITKEKHDFW